MEHVLVLVVAVMLVATSNPSRARLSGVIVDVGSPDTAQGPAIRIHTMSLTEGVSRKPNTLLPFLITCFLLKILHSVVQELSC